MDLTNKLAPQSGEDHEANSQDSHGNGDKASLSDWPAVLLARDEYSRRGISWADFDPIRAEWRAVDYAEGDGFGRYMPPSSICDVVLIAEYLTYKAAEVIGHE